MQSPFRTEAPPPSANQCGQMISGGMMSFPCILARGHEAFPPDDPEPHYVRESAAVGRAWGAWKERQDIKNVTADQLVATTDIAAQQVAQDTGEQFEVCPACDERSLFINGADARCMNEDCGYEAEVPSALRAPARRVEDFWPAGEARPTVAVDDCRSQSQANIQHPAHYWTTPYESIDMVRWCGGIPLYEAQPWTPPIMRIRGDAIQAARLYSQQSSDDSQVEIHFMGPNDDLRVGSLPFRLMLMDVDTSVLEPTSQPIIDEAQHFAETGRLFDQMAVELGRGAGEDQAQITAAGGVSYADGVPTSQVPTKQREGDQVLPNGGLGSISVQQFIIDSMTESIRVGTERYGQALMQFDGRSNIRDIHEEARDLFVYTGKMLQMGEADRTALEAVVRHALIEDGMVDHAALRASEVAVGHILDWVITKVHGGD